MDGNKPLISVIVPVYNVRDYLPRCLESVIGQSYRDLEILVVDDGSTDDSLAICRRYEEREPRMKVFHQENGGLGSARDYGLEYASGDYIYFIDSDDYLEPDGLQYLLEDMLVHDADMGVAAYVVDDFDGIRPAPHVPEALTIEGPAALMRAYFETEFIKSFAWNKLYKAELWKEIRFPHYYSSEDNATCYKIFELVKKTRVLPRPFYHYVMRESSVDHAFARNIEKDFVSIEAAEDRYRFVSSRYPELEKLADENRWRIRTAMVQRLFAAGGEFRYRTLLKEWIAFFRQHRAPTEALRRTKRQIAYTPYLFGWAYKARWNAVQFRNRGRKRAYMRAQQQSGWRNT